MNSTAIQESTTVSLPDGPDHFATVELSMVEMSAEDHMVTTTHAGC